MAFQTKYRTSFKDRSGSTWYIYFQYDPWAGAVTDLQCGDTPATLRYLTDSKYGPIVGSTLDIRLENSLSVDAMFTEADKVVRVILQSAVREFVGFLNANQYYRELSNNTHQVTLTATNELGSLKEEKFEDGSDDPYYYLTTDLIALSNIIEKTGTWETMKEDINIYGNLMNATATDTPLDQTYFYPEMYWDEVHDERGDCHTVLMDILKKYGARVFFSENTWFLQRVNAAWAKRTIRQYTSASAPWVYFSNTSAYNLFNVDDESAEWMAHAEVSKKARVGRSEITANPGRKDNLIKTSTFEDFTQLSGFPRYWTLDSASESGEDGYWRIYDAEAVFVGGDGTDPGSTTDKVYTDITFWDEIDTVNIVISFKAVYSVSTNCFLHFALSNQAETGWWNPATKAFQGTEVHYVLDVDTEIGGTMTDYAVLTIPITNFDYFIGGIKLLRFHMYEVADNNDTTAYVDIDSVRFEPTYLTGDLGYQIVSIDNTVRSNTSIIDEIRQCSNFGSLAATDDLYWTLRSSTGSTAGTLSWTIIGDQTTGDVIQYLLARQYLQGNQYPVDTISGTLIGDYRYNKALVEPSLVDHIGYAKTFIPLDMAWDVARKEWRGNWEEVTAVYNDEELDWASHTYSTATITNNSIDIDTYTVGTMGATSDPYTAVAGEMIRIKVTATDDGSGIEPNYAFDGNTGELDWGVNYLEFMATAGAKTFQINHTNGEDAVCTVSFILYSMK